MGGRRGVGRRYEIEHDTRQIRPLWLCLTHLFFSEDDKSPCIPQLLSCRWYEIEHRCCYIGAGIMIVVHRRMHQRYVDGFLFPEGLRARLRATVMCSAAFDVSREAAPLAPADLFHLDDVQVFTIVIESLLLTAHAFLPFHRMLETQVFGQAVSIKDGSDLDRRSLHPLLLTIFTPLHVSD